MSDYKRDYFEIKKIYSISYFDLSKNRAELSFDDKWVIVFFKGEGECFYANGKKYLIQNNNMYFFADEKIDICADILINKTCKMYVISMDVQMFKICKFDNEMCSLRYNYLLTLIEKEIKKAFTIKSGITINDFNVKNTYFLGAAQVISIYIEQYLITFLEKNQYKTNYLKSGTKNNNLIVEINEYLEDNITKNLKNEEICRRFNYSISLINSQFKKYFGRTLHEQFIFLKIEKAKNMLRKENVTLKYVSDVLCFTTPESFSKIFKKVTGITPREYNKNIKTD